MASEVEEKHQQLRRAAYELAAHKKEPSSWVHMMEIAKRMGLKDPGTDEDVRDELTGMVVDLQEEGDVEGWSPTNGRFRLTAEGIRKVENE